jgi:hypothetical protein
MGDKRLLLIFLFLLPLLLIPATNSKELQKSQTFPQTNLRTYEKINSQANLQTESHTPTSVKLDKEKKSVTWHGNENNKSVVVAEYAHVQVPGK